MRDKEREYARCIAHCMQQRKCIELNTNLYGGDTFGSRKNARTHTSLFERQRQAMAGNGSFVFFTVFVFQLLYPFFLYICCWRFVHLARFFCYILLVIDSLTTYARVMRSCNKTQQSTHCIPIHSK